VANNIEDARAVVQHLMRDYEIYDQAVDVVSAFEFLFTVPADMTATVTHFERFPKVASANGGDPDTPDFTVLFNDGTALVGEIARLSLQSKSVDSACAQLGRYDQFTHVPDAAGRLVEVRDVSVMQIVPLDVGPDAVDRIIHNRMLNNEHPYRPSKAPCIVQFARDPDRYMFQRISDVANGIVDGHQREPHLGARIRKINVPASGFATIKATKKFMNDPVPPLYLAVILYTQVWPTDFQGRQAEIAVTPSETARVLQSRYGAGTANDVRNAMTLLISAGLAADNKDGTYTVAKRPRAREEHDLARNIAQRSADQAKPMVKAQRTGPAAPSNQLSLFD
jgi:hypothetical protein